MRLAAILLTRLGCLLALGGCGIIPNSVSAPDRDDGRIPPEVVAEFEGDGTLLDREMFLAARADLFDLSDGATPDAAAFDAARSVELAYRQIGYPKVKVTASAMPPESREGESDRVVVRFNVEQGPQYTTRGCVLTGVDDEEREQLMELWQRTGAGTLGLGAPLFVKSELRTFATALATTFSQRGHLDVNVRGPELEWHDEEREVSVRLHVERGPLYSVRQVDVTRELRELLGDDVAQSAAGSPFTPRRAQELALETRAALRRQGYPSPTVRAKVSPPDRAHRVAIRIEGETGPEATFGTVRIGGAEVTDPDYIRSKIPFSEGDEFNADALDRGIENLYRTGLFHRVQVEQDPVKDGKANLGVDVEEVERHTFEFLAGYGSYERLRGGTTYIGRNLLGQGRTVRLLSRLSQRGYRGEAEVTDHDLFGSDLSGTLRGTIFRREEPAFRDEAGEVTAFLQTELLPNVEARFGYSIVERLDSELFSFDPTAPQVNFTEGKAFIELIHDRRDSLLTPTSGYNVSFEVDVADSALGSDVDYIRAQVHSALHLPVAGKVRLSMRWTSGALWPQNGSQIPLQVRFYNGGENTVRSFREDRLGPADAQGRPIGGEYRNIWSVEVRAPLFDSLEFSVFGDAGHVGASIDDYEFGNVDYAVGAGLRYVLPIGPVRLDAALDPERQGIGDDWTVHFSIGYPF